VEPLLPLKFEQQVSGDYHNIVASGHDPIWLNRVLRRCSVDGRFHSREHGSVSPIMQVKARHRHSLRALAVGAA